ncbi:hypothetical protein Desdi_1419 [Desulfitobacterium dichloroeliminans LMG P-21439]|uniref:Uncharacterized protein n=1 Tax=Desulfitobacterium dichloroeliminans (strain LMG P-21439 / DCA1) TaxID=871963 RepID=L0F8D9_DESDL|nr:hypothetical protein Desdi_1419 [Desulfitobacterium dichloroeliminans LMG P-21439]
MKIRKDILQPYLDDRGYKLCYSISLRRSTDKYKSEEDMQWTHRFSGNTRNTFEQLAYVLFCQGIQKL